MAFSSFMGIFSIVILLNIISHYTSLKAINNKISNLNIDQDHSSKKLNNYTKAFNKLMIIFIFLALVFLLSFVSINI